MRKTENTTTNYDFAVIGGGLVGMTAAFALGKRGYNTLLFAPTPPQKDTRTTAFLWNTVLFFQELELWNDLQDIAFPLEVMRIVDSTTRLFRAPQVDFNSAEIDIDAFGYNLLNYQVIELLNSKLSALETVTSIRSNVDQIHRKDDGFSLMIEKGKQTKEFQCRYLIGADGRNSMVRDSLLPGIREWSYPQTAIVLDFEHQYSSHRTSTEFHTDTGPFTVVPQSDKKAGLVWMERPERVDQLLLMDINTLEHLLETKMQSFLGKVKIVNTPRSFPIKGLVAKQFGDDNALLIGEAAHVFPPIGAQGFNLGVRDIKSALEVFARYTNTENRGRLYHESRRTDITSRTAGVDMLNRSLLSEWLPYQFARAFGLYSLGSFPTLRKMAMKQGISPAHRIDG